MKRFSLASHVLLPVLFFTFAVLAYGQNNTATNSMAYLNQQFPQLTMLYEPELQGMKTHYIFAVDVSGSMKKYDETVTPALQAFARALPVGERVTVIPFGTTAKDNTPGLSVEIANDGTKSVLTGTLTTLYTNDAYTPDFKRNTDVNAAVAAINKTLLNNQEAKMNVVVIITDFLNDLPGKGEVKLMPGQLDDLSKNFNNSTEDMNVRVVAMKLPPMGSGKGYCLDQLSDSVFNLTNDNRRFEIVPVISNQAAISHWFEQLSRDIMTEKLRAVIQLDNKNVTPRINTEIDIDGNTKGDIHWVPSKLYTQVSIDSIYADSGSDYEFRIGKDVIQITGDSVLIFEKMGKFKNKSWGLRQYDEPLNLRLSLPTPYDAELKKLSIDKPTPQTAQEKIGWLWTFLLPFWLCVALIILFIIYIILVIKAAQRNAADKFKGRVDFTDHRGRPVGETAMIRPTSGQINIGATGTGDLGVANAEWSVVITKESPSPFTFWKKPKYKWQSKGHAVDGRNRHSGYFGRYGEPGTTKRLSLECGVDSEHVTHGVDITML